MSVVSSRISSVSSILKDTGVRSQLINQPDRVHFKLPKNIKTILCNFQAGKGVKEYEELIYLLRIAVMKDSELTKLLTETRQYISLLTPTHKLYIEALLQIQWIDKPADVSSVYKLFLEDLVSMQNYYSKTVIDHLVGLFHSVEDSNVEHEPGNLKSEDLEKLNHIHGTLHKILELVPMSSKLLLQSLQSRFPYIIHGTYTHEVYIYALLQILSYAPQLRSDILSLILNRLMILDVNIPRKNNTDDNEEDDPMNNTEEVTDAKNPNLADSNNTDKMKATERMVHTLDICMELFFKYMHNFCFKNNVVRIEQLKILYSEILQAFEIVMLPTYGSQYVQYTIFYLCSFKAAVAETFVDWLWCKVTDSNVASFTRQSAMFYISSLLASASFVNLGVIKLMFFKLTRWIHNYIATQKSSKYNDDITIHGVFYSACQAFFYLFTVRCKDFVKSTSGILFLQEFDIDRIITCRLNPLKICNIEIVHKFADITRMYQLAYCYTIIENNARNEQSDFQSEICPYVLIPNFFPFESYTLPYSEQRIIPLFNEKVIGKES